MRQLPHAAAGVPVLMRALVFILALTFAAPAFAQQHPDPNVQARIDAMTELLNRAERPAIAILRDKPNDSAPARSYFGGRPRMPASIAWPESSATHAPMSFFAQIDLAELPPSAAQRGLPARGVLYFFGAYVDGTLDERERVAVRYADGAGADWPEREPPRALGRFTDEQPYTWFEPTDPLARFDLRTPIHFVPVRSTLSGEYGGAGDLEAMNTRLREDIQAALGRPLREGPSDFREPDSMADEAWPHAGLYAELGAAALKANLPFIETRSFRPEAPEWTAAGRRMRQTIADEADREIRRWRARRYETMSDRERREFREWVASVKTRSEATPSSDTSGQSLWSFMTDYGLEESRHFAGYALMAKGADASLLPAEYRGDFDWIGSEVPLHQMLGYGFSWQTAPQDHIADVLLLQINGWSDLFWLTESGCTVGFWISRPALAAKRFDLVTPTLECD